MVHPLVFSALLFCGSLPFQVGERLVYSIEWGPIKAGKGSFEIVGIIPLKGKDCYHVVSYAWSNPTFSFFYKVEDRVESFMEVEKLYTRKFEKHIREGNFKTDVIVDFDQEKGKAIYSDEKVFPLIEEARDALASLYYTRTLPLKVGESIYINNHTDRTNYPLEIKIHRKEQVETKVGTFDCIVVEPVLRYSGLFEQKGKLTVWLTDDGLRIPVLMKSKIIIGSIKAVLEEMKLQR
ncbi:MAG: DUF3108 domain-containing protein [Candidatus Edwardsbacteria bacterium]